MPIEDMVEEKNELTDEILKPLIMQAIELGIRNMGVSEEHGGGGGRRGDIRECCRWSACTVTPDCIELLRDRTR